MSEAVAAPAPAAPPPSVHERLKSFLGAQSSPATQPAEDGAGRSEDSAEQPKATSVAPKIAPAEKPAPNEQVEGDDASPETDPEVSEVDVTDEDDAPVDLAQLKSLTELADATGLESDRLMDLELPVKIDGKAGTARLRDLVKSYQLDGHINQKLASLDTDRKTFEAKRQEAERAVGDRLLKLDAGVKTLERALMGEFNAVDWQKLQQEDPVRFNSEYVAYQQRFAVMQDIAGQIADEQKQYQQSEQAKAQERFAEEFKLLQAKVPEWSDAGKRNKDKAEIVDVISKDYGITKEEFESIVDHRQLLVVRDAVAWRKLQKSKPALLNKVKTAPKLLRPGTPQSQAARNSVALQKSRERLKQTGRARDAVPALKSLLFGR